MVGALAAALLACSTSYAASFGHSRVVSALGQPLRIDVPITQLSPDDLRSLAVRPAPAADWKQAGLVPPVDLASLQLRLIDGYTPGTKVLQLRSSQVFDRPVADLLLDVRTASGQQRYQVSLLTQAGPQSLAAQRSSALRASGQSAGGQDGIQQVPQKSIHVKPGDTMFAIALRNAVPGVSVYQMMIALQRANPQAFIQNNVNLVKAGATLSMPGMAALTAISDKEARRIFQKQAQAFALYRQRLAGSTPAVGQEAGAAASGTVSAASQPSRQEPAQGPQDQLRLSGSSQAAQSGRTANAAAGGSGSTGAAGDAAARADDRVATRKGIQDSEQRVSQLEENVKHLSQALQSQGGAATDLVIGGAKGLGQTLSDAADAVTGSSSGTSTANQPDAAADKGKSGGAAGTSSEGQAGPGSGTGNGASNNAAQEGSGADSAVNTENGAANGSSTGQAGSQAAAESAGGKSEGDKGNGISAATDGSSSADNGAAAPAGSGQGGPAATASPPAGPQPGAPADGKASPGAATGGQAGASADSGSSGDKAGNAAGAGPGAAGNTNNGASAGTDGANGAAQTDTTKAGQTVSWFQEHMLGVITGILAFIVLIIAWLLRRANTGRDDDNHGVITETMVKEKLEQINLDLEQDPSPGSRSGRS
ncbi:FimV/HubP family polar landmark protein [Pollutimonas sp. H1-120]|uniref:FimV/HubP family polar landmark protein n=1 Tax=Pollutimonas sp. H1-120 TaxID=3148824 RepID=UPI003B51DE3C